ETEDVLLNLRYFDEVRPIQDGEQQCVRVGAGCQIKRLLSELEGRTELTLPSVGFITEQTVAGAISTGTHGSGRNSLSHYVTSARIARYDLSTGKSVIEEINSGDDLQAARCSLGCLGVIVSVTMKCRPKYLVEEHFREYQQLDDVIVAEDEYPLQQFYLVPWRWSYFAQHRRELAVPSKTIWLYQWYRFLVIDVAMNLLILLAVRLLRIQAAVKAVFRWIAPTFVIRNWRVAGPSSSQLVMKHELFRHIEIELFVQRHRLPEALLFLRNAIDASAHPKNSLSEGFQRQLEDANTSGDLHQLRGRYCHHYPICVRKILPDDTLISMASNVGIEYQSSSNSTADLLVDEAWYSITLTNYNRGNSRKPFEELAAFLAKSMLRLFDARPHWGKLCPLSTSELRMLYPAFKNFRGVCCRVDKDGVFRNQWTEELLQCEPPT
ncbi:MAG: FAD-binding protein, partial [bacterium]|nr:FAD-binding protein [bacterium]